MYGATVKTARTGLPGGSGGFVFPIKFPLTFGLSSGGGNDVTINNTGNVSSYPVAVIYGPAKSPALTLKVGTQTYLFALDNLDLAAGDTVTIDFAKHTVTTNTFGSAYSLVRPGSVWWSLPAGTSTVSYTAFSSASPSRAEINYRNGYML